MEREKEKWLEKKESSQTFSTSRFFMLFDYLFIFRSQEEGIKEKQRILPLTTTHSG